MESESPTANSGFAQWLVYFSLAGNYSTGNLHIFTTKRKIVATARSRGTLADILPKNTKNEIKKHICIFYNSFI
jgi:hypothetical protein